MKLQPASVQQIRGVALIGGLCTAAMVGVFAALGAAGVVNWSWRVIAGAAGGWAIATLNFALMCRMVEQVAGIPDQKKVRARVQASYNARMMLQGVWCVAAIILPCFQPVAAILPLLFPRIALLVEQIRQRQAAPGRMVETTATVVEETDAGEPNADATATPAPEAAPAAEPLCPDSDQPPEAAPQPTTETR